MAAFEALGKRKKIGRRRGLRIWNDEIEAAIKGKQAAYIAHLQANTDESKELYKEKRNYATQLIRHAHQQSWDQMITTIEHDIHGRQALAYKMMKHFNTSEREIARLSVIGKDQWVEHYKNLWYHPINTTETNKDANYYNNSVDSISLEELKIVLRSMKNRKASGLDGLSAELFKYGGSILEL